MKALTLFVAAHVAFVFAPVVLAQEVSDEPLGDVAEARPITPEERAIVESLIERVRAEPTRSTPVESSVVEMRRRWLLRTLERLEEFMAEHPRMDQVVTWRESLGLTEIRHELAKHPPDLSRLRQVRDEDLFSREAAGEFDDHATDARQLGARIVLSYLRATDRYVEALDDRFDDRLIELAESLQQYIDATNLKERRARIKTIHSIVEDIRASNQAEDLTNYIRDRYLHPRARAFVSSEVLTHVVGLVPLPSLPRSQYADGTFVQGVATPTRRLFITGVANDGIGVLEGGYVGPVVFGGTAQRNHINLGICVNLDARFTKRLFLIQGAADTSRTSHRLTIGSTGSSGGHLVDRIADRTIRSNFDAASLTSELANGLDNGVTRVANFLDRALIQRIKQRIQESEGDITRARDYRSTSNGVQLTIRSAREGFREPDEEPPSSLGVGSEHEFSLSVRRGLSSDLLAGRQFKLQQVDRFLRSVLGLSEGTVDDSISISFPTNQPVVAYVQDETDKDDIEVIVTLLVDQDEVKIRLYPRHRGGALMLSPIVSVPTNPELQARLASLLEDFKQVERIVLPESSSEDAGDDGTISLKVGKVAGLRFSLSEHYVTLSGEGFIAD